MLTDTKETNKARDARIGVREAVARRAARIAQAPYGRVIIDTSLNFERYSQRKDSAAAVVFERLLLGALGEAKAHSQGQRDLLDVWVAYANWKAVAR